MFVKQKRDKYIPSSHLKQNVRFQATPEKRKRIKEIFSAENIWTITYVKNIKFHSQL